MARCWLVFATGTMAPTCTVRTAWRPVAAGKRTTRRRLWSSLEPPVSPVPLPAGGALLAGALVWLARQLDTTEGAAVAHVRENADHMNKMSGDKAFHWDLFQIERNVDKRG